MRVRPLWYLEQNVENGTIKDPLLFLGATPLCKPAIHLFEMRNDVLSQIRQSSIFDNAPKNSNEDTPMAIQKIEETAQTVSEKFREKEGKKTRRHFQSKKWEGLRGRSQTGRDSFDKFPHLGLVFYL